MKTLRRAGFSLVELLVVIEIIAILFSLLVPTLASYVTSDDGGYTATFIYNGQRINPPTSDPTDNVHSIQYGGVIQFSYLVSGNPSPVFDEELPADPVTGITGYVPDPNSWLKQNDLWRCPESVNGGLSPQSPHPKTSIRGKARKYRDILTFRFRASPTGPTRQSCPTINFSSDSKPRPNDRFVL